MEMFFVFFNKKITNNYDKHNVITKTLKWKWKCTEVQNKN